MSRCSSNCKNGTMDGPSPPIQDSINSKTEQPILVLISHSHRRPLFRPPNLKFDLRRVSNPPKHIRDAYDGRSKRLREHMMHIEDFKSLLDTAKKSIENEMEALVQTNKGKSEKISLGSVYCFLQEAYRTSIMSRKTGSLSYFRRERHQRIRDYGRGYSSACCELLLRTWQASECGIR
jgi:hypothetical protein